jgi:hypothetical protein
MAVRNIYRQMVIRLCVYLIVSTMSRFTFILFGFFLHSLVLGEVVRSSHFQHELKISILIEVPDGKSVSGWSYDDILPLDLKVNNMVVQPSYVETHRSELPPSVIDDCGFVILNLHTSQFRFRWEDRMQGNLRNEVYYEINFNVIDVVEFRYRVRFLDGSLSKVYTVVSRLR